MDKIDWSKIEALAAEKDDCDVADSEGCSLCVAIRAAREMIKLKPQENKPLPARNPLMVNGY